MCDYSLMGVPNRLASEGEELVVCEFRTGSQGLTAPDTHEIDADRPPNRLGTFLSVIKRLLEPAPEKVAVCIPPGARLLLHDIPEEARNCLGVEATEEVVFTQLTAKDYAYRDAVRFKNGCELMLQRLKQGQRVTVLELAPEGETEESVWQEGESLGFRTMRIDFIAPRLYR